MHGNVTPVLVDTIASGGFRDLSKRASIEAIPYPAESSQGARADVIIAGCSPSPVGISRAILGR